MTELVQIGLSPAAGSAQSCAPGQRSQTVFWLQAVTLAWMTVECGVALYAAAAAHSTALLAFGSDSVVELFSAVVVLLPYVSNRAISQWFADRVAALLLFVLALIVASTSVMSLLFHWRLGDSLLGMLVTIAALVAMPALAALKRREARRIHNAALAADAAQSAACAYLALITLAGLAIHRVFHAPWVDPLAALLCIPILVHEGRSAWAGQACHCCG